MGMPQLASAQAMSCKIITVLVTFAVTAMRTTAVHIPEGHHMMPGGKIMADIDMQMPVKPVKPEDFDTEDVLDSMVKTETEVQLNAPTHPPTRQPSAEPTKSPGAPPTKSPTAEPTKSPGAPPTKSPTPAPSEVTYATSDGTTEGVCASDGSSYYYTETVSSTVRSITANMCPNHPWTKENPNTPYGKTVTYEVPLYPKAVSDEYITDLSEAGGGVGVLINGAFLYSAYGGAQYGKVTSYETSAPLHEGDTFDQCGCHASGSTGPTYHCHVPPSCLLQQLGQTDDSHSPQIGWAADGFPVYGPRGKDGAMVQTCSVSGGTYGTDTCSDDCTGVGSATGGEDWIDDGYTYRYYVIGPYDDGKQCTSPSPLGTSSAEYYPMTAVCLKGCLPAGVSGSGFGQVSLPSCSAIVSAGGTATKGWTRKPSAASTLSQNTEACANYLDTLLEVK